MDPIYQGFCDIFYITNTLQKVLKKVMKKGVDQPYMYDQLFTYWADTHNFKYRSKASLSVYFAGTEIIPKIPAFYAKPENFLELCKDIQNNILVRLPNHSQIVQEIFEALDADDHLIDEKCSQYFELRERYFPNDQQFALPALEKDALLNWEAHLLAEILLLVITDPIFLRKGAKDHTPILRKDYQSKAAEWHNIVPDPYLPFYGRVQELTELDRLFQVHKHIFLTGVPGLGKSELAKNYVTHYRKHRFQTFYLFYTGNLKSDIIHMLNSSRLSLVPVSPTAPTQLALIFEKIDVTPEDLWERCMDFLRSLSPDDLIVIDNLDALPEGTTTSDMSIPQNSTFCKEPLIAALLALRCRLLISTRCDYQQLQLSFPYHCMEVQKLDMTTLMQLFSYYYPEAVDQASISQGIIEAVFCNTLLVKMTAKLLHESFWTPDQVLKEFKNNLANTGIRDTVTCEIDGQLYSQTISSHIDTLLMLSRLTDAHMKILRYMCLMPSSGISWEVFRTMAGLKDSKDLQRLIYMGFIQRNHKNCLSMHSLLKEILLHKTKPTYSNCSVLLKNLNQVCVKRVGYKDSLLDEVSEILESLVPRLDTDFRRKTNLRGYFHFIQDAIPFQYSYGKMESARILLDRLEALLKLPDYNLPLDRMILNATRILIEENHKEDFDQKFERILSIMGASPLIMIDYHFMGTLLHSMIYCVTKKKGEKMYAILDNVLRTVSCHTSSKLVRLFCYPVSIYIGRKELSKYLLQLPAHEEADCSIEQMNAEIETLLLEAPSEEPT